MANGSSRQNSAASPASQVRRSSRNSRSSIIGMPNRQMRQPSIRRFSSNIDPNLLEDFDWTGQLDFGFEQQTGDGQNFDIPYFQDDGIDYSGFDQVVLAGIEDGQVHTALPGGNLSSNLYENPTVAVPGTPRAMGFANSNQQAALPLGNEVPQVNINGRAYLIWGAADGTTQLLPIPQDTGPQTMVTDGKRTSVPKSPGLSRKRPHSQYQDPYMGGAGNIDPTVFQNNRYDGFVREYHTQPYYHSSYPNGAPSPGGRSSKRVRSHAPDFANEGQNRKAKSQSASSSSYPSRGESSSEASRGNSRSNAKKRRYHAPPDKRFSMFNADLDHLYQKPQISTFNPKVRINKTTKGLTTRTAKINAYDPRKFYTYTPHPLGTPDKPYGADWKGRYTHKYRDTSYGDEDGLGKVAIFELEDRAMSADKIKDFILHYPYERNKLTLMIQVAPGDSARRYDQDASKCRFADCPARNGGENATIIHGWYRVAFDERNDDRYDPFAACCGFVHLYCMERFLDFEYICRKAYVVVDQRSHLRGEPRGTFGGSFDSNYKQKEAGQLAENFVQYARSKPNGDTRRQRGDRLGVRQMELLANYPVYRDWGDDIWPEAYPFEDTLSYHMMRVTETSRAYAQLKQFAGGDDGKKLGPTKMSVNRGDLGMYAEAQVRTKAKRKKPKKGKASNKGKKAADGDVFGGHSLFDVEVHRRIQRALEVVKAAKAAKELHNRSALTKDGKGTARAEGEEQEEDSEEEPWAKLNDDESDFDENHTSRNPRNGTRMSKRTTKKKLNYREEPDEGQYRANKRLPQQQGPSQPHDDDQYYWNQLREYADPSYPQHPYPESVVPARRSSSVPNGYIRVQEPWEAANYSQYQQEYDDLGLNFYVGTPCTPRTPEQHKHRRSFQAGKQLSYGDIHQIAEQPAKRKRFSPVEQLDELGIQSAQPSKRLRSHEDQAGSLSRYPSASIIRQPGSRTPSDAKRHASFNNKPVSDQKTFDSDAPPHNVQKQMVKELEISTGAHKASLGSSKSGTLSPKRTTRSGRLFGSTSE